MRTQGLQGRGDRAGKAGVASPATKNSGSPSQQVRASQPRRPSLQGSIYPVSIFLPVYW